MWLLLVLDRTPFRGREGRENRKEGGSLNSGVILGLLKECGNHKLSVNPARAAVYIPKVLALGQGSCLKGNNFPIPSEPGV